MDITKRLADYVEGLRFEYLPLEVVEKSKHCILDLLGIMMRARFDAESSDPVTEAVRELNGAGGRCTAIGNKEDFHPHYAALLNGTYAHSLDFDDTHRRGSIHPGCVIIPTALAMAESEGVSGKALITAVVAGYDVGCRISEAVGPKVHYDRGFHPSATAGVFGGTAGGASILKMTSEDLQNAFGLNGSQAAGSMQFLENGAWNKRVHVGLAAHNAIISLKMAQKGVLGAAYPLEGKAGFFHAYSDGANPELAVRGLGEEFQIMHTALKPYPSCRFTHAPIDLILEIVTTNNLLANDIEEIVIGLPSKGMDIVGIPADKKRRPHNVVNGQFSMYFTGAVAAAYRQLTWRDYQRINEPLIKSLMDLTVVIHDLAAEAVYPGTFAGSVAIKARGQIFTGFTELSKGEPEKPLSWEEVVAKFNDLVPNTFDKERKAMIIKEVADLENVVSVRELTSFLRV